MGAASNITDVTRASPVIASVGGGLAGLAAGCALSDAGFAVTLFIGLISNLFTSIFVSKTLFEAALFRRHQVASLSI